MNINTLLQSLGAATQESDTRIQAEIEATRADNAKVAQLSQLNLDDMRSALGMQQDAASVKAANELATRMQLERAQSVAGFDPRAAEDEFTRSMAKLTAAQTERVTVRKEYDKLQQTNFFDDPLGYIFAQMDMPTVAAKHNSLVDLELDSAANVEMRSSMLKQYNSAVTANTANELAAQNAALAKASALESQVKLREAELSISARQAADRWKLVQMEDKLIDNKSRALNTQLNIAQAQMAMEDRREARAERIALSRERLADKRLKDEEVARVDTNLATLSARLGQVDASGRPLIHSQEALRKSPLTAKQKAEFYQAAQTGMFGNDILDSLAFLAGSANSRVLARTDKGFVDMLAGVKNGITTYQSQVRKPDKLGNSPKEKEVLPLAADAYLQSVVASASDPKAAQSLTGELFDTVFNPYRAPHLAVVDSALSGSGKLGALKDNLLVKAVQTVQTAKGAGADGTFKGVDERRAIKVAVELGTKQGLPVKEIARQIGDYYTAATALGADLYHYESINLPTQTRYMATVDGTGVFGDPMRVDMLNAASRERAVAKLIAPARAITQDTSTLFGIKKYDSMETK